MSLGCIARGFAFQPEASFSCSPGTMSWSPNKETLASTRSLFSHEYWGFRRKSSMLTELSDANENVSKRKSLFRKAGITSQRQKKNPDLPPFVLRVSNVKPCFRATRGFRGEEIWDGVSVFRPRAHSPYSLSSSLLSVLVQLLC